MFIRNYRKSCIVLVLLVFLEAGLAARSSAQAPTSVCQEKVVQMLDASSLTYKTHNSNVWSIAYAKESLKDFRAIISTDGKDLVVIFVIVAKKAQLTLSPEFLQTLLRSNHDFDYVKVGLDNDGDLFVRTDATCHLLDAAEMKARITQVANSANELYTSVKSWISAAK